MSDVSPLPNLAHRHNVDAVLLVADGKADEFGLSSRSYGIGGRIRGMTANGRLVGGS